MPFVGRKTPTVLPLVAVVGGRASWKILKPCAFAGTVPLTVKVWFRAAPLFGKTVNSTVLGAVILRLVVHAGALLSTFKGQFEFEGVTVKLKLPPDAGKVMFSRESS